jgi:hypothetical protein
MGIVVDIYIILLKTKKMNKIITLVFLFMSIMTFGQKFDANYNLVIDYNGGERIEKEFSGRWMVKDSLLCQIYGKDTLEYKISKIQGRNVFHINGFEETVKFTFNANGDVTRMNLDRTNQYIIYRYK